MNQKSSEQKIDDLQLSSISSQKTEQDQIYTTFRQYISKVRKVNDKKRKQVIELLNELISTNLKIVPYKQVNRKNLQIFLNNPETFLSITNYNNQRADQLNKMKSDLNDSSQLHQSMCESRDELNNELIKTKDKLFQLKQKVSDTQQAISELDQEMLALNKLNLNLYTQIYQKKLIRNEMRAYLNDRSQRIKTNFKSHLKNLFVNRHKSQLVVQKLQKCRNELQGLFINERNRAEDFQVLTIQINQLQTEISYKFKQNQKQYIQYEQVIQAKQAEITKNALNNAEEMCFKYDAKINQYAQFCIDIIQNIRTKYPNHKLPSLDCLINEMKKNIMQMGSQQKPNKNNMLTSLNPIIQEQQIESSKKDEQSKQF